MRAKPLLQSHRTTIILRTRVPNLIDRDLRPTFRFFKCNRKDDSLSSLLLTFLYTFELSSFHPRQRFVIFRTSFLTRCHRRGPFSANLIQRRATGQRILSHGISNSLPTFLRQCQGGFHSRFTNGPNRVIFIFFPVVDAYTMGRRATQLRAKPSIARGTLLALPTRASVIRTPFFGNRKVFARRSFAQAKGVNGSSIRRQSRQHRIYQVVTNRGSNEISPFRRVLNRRLQTIPRSFIKGGRTSLQRDNHDRYELSPKDDARIRRS